MGDYRPIIRVLSIEDAEELSAAITNPTAIISITSPGAPKADLDEANPNVRKIFRMRFYDIDDGMKTRHAKPKRKQFAGLKQFLDETREQGIPLIVVHCEGGVSRSAGVACAVNDYFNTGYNFWGQEHLHPNIRVYRMACENLGIPRTRDYLEEVFEIRKAHSAFCKGDPEKLPKMCINAPVTGSRATS